MRAISVFSFDAGTSSFCWRALIALRIRVSKSATGSVKLILFSSYPFRVSPPRRKPVRNVLPNIQRSKTAIGSSEYRILLPLPGRLRNPGDFASQRQPAEAQAADAELAQIRARTSADLAAVVLTSRKLWLSCRLGNM